MRACTKNAVGRVELVDAELVGHMGQVGLEGQILDVKAVLGQEIGGHKAGNVKRRTQRLLLAAKVHSSAKAEHGCELPGAPDRAAVRAVNNPLLAIRKAIEPIPTINSTYR